MRETKDEINMQVIKKNTIKSHLILTILESDKNPMQATDQPAKILITYFTKKKTRKQ